MIPRLLEDRDRRILVVAGKGGVGKTTTAGALAVAAAAGGAPVHLISTDPAHSLGDLFRQPLEPGEPASCEEVPGLVLEEFSAAEALERWRAVAEDPIAELMAAGTYLDEEDIRAFLEGPLPGADEVMAALRLAELGREPEGHLVVDTAPAGHALRLLDAHEVMRSWHAALSAMARKAGAVAAGLTGRSVRLSAEAFVDELGERADAFRTMLRSRAAGAVIVTRSEAAVRRETLRLRRALEARGIDLAGVVRITASEEEAGPRGAEALGRWARSLGGRATVPPSDGGPSEEGADGTAGATDGPSAATERTAGEGRTEAVARPGDTEAPPDAADPEGLADLFPGGREILLFVGKGGVGKTTCAAACALALSDAGKPVALLGTDPAGASDGLLGRLAGMADGEGSGNDLVLRQVDADADLRRFRRRHEDEVRALAEGLGLDEALALDRAVLETLLDLSPPGLDELFALTMLTRGRTGRLLVIDTSPTGHFLRLLETPEVALGWSRSLMRILLKYRSVLGLGDLAARLLAFSRRVRELQERLADPETTGVFVVCTPEPMVQAETARLCEALERAGLPVAATIRNRAPGGGGSAAPAEPPDGSPAETPCGRGDVPVLAAPERTVSCPREARAFFRAWRRVA